ncbi:uncharacterized protein PgNI_01689 [Pyricularia grisea]|uniref:Uncharacterized protein n=1 Tax=Pyricularia grisea TaxID=148305 RepID=A0A6P8BHK2_PYRGI|nr:uncharacterized protein PgNI_01689 [Pyricularia grisea]TLD16205.1 hypothetical protein PgNI_01689 [Pyricularia grisea]
MRTMPKIPVPAKGRKDCGTSAATFCYGLCISMDVSARKCS